MSAIWRSFDAGAFVTDEVREAARRRLRALGGVALVVLAATLGVALATWSAQDPSLTHATKTPVSNLLGYPGAVASDLLMQLIGLASIALLLPIAVWGWRLTGQRPLDRERLRLALWFGGVLAAAAFVACLPASPRWPLPSGLGGTLGDALLRIPAFVLGSPLTGFNRALVAMVAGTAALFMLAFAAGASWPARRGAEEDEIEESLDTDEHESRRGWLLGWLAHAFLASRARAMRAVAFARDRFASRDRLAEPDYHERGRIEPRWRDAPPVEAPLREADRFEPEPDEQADSDPDPEPDPKPARQPARKAKSAARNNRRNDDAYELPPHNLLAAPKPLERAALSSEQLQENATALEGVLEDFGVRGEIINARPGPVVTLYELEPAPGIKSSRVIGLADDIARSMSAISARVAVVQGRNAIGIELPNPRREKVFLRELLAADDYTNASAKLALCLGKTIGGEPVIVDLARMPHLLIAGTTGSGKSVAINTMILSLLYRLTPDQCRLIMVDPKMLELSVYDGIPHLLTPVVTDPKKAVTALKWAVREMEDRYRKMSKLGVRNIDGYNARVAEAKGKGETLSRTVHTGYDKESGEAIYEEELLDLEPLPLLVVIVDEMADLMMVAGKDIEGAIQRLAQMARAAGIHVILATQRPSVDVITGTIKANFPTRISFQVTSKIDSRTILGEQGAEQLLGQGDMLYMAGGGRISRVHGPFVSDEEVEKVVRHLKSQGQPQYLEAVTASESEDGEDGAVFDATAMGGEAGPDLYAQAVQVVLRDRKASTSYIQRRLQIGYNRAASLMERMEKEGIVGQPNHAGKREILVEGEAD
jgi:DNA segregation ATPase FtsK/SpoIIIE, S-DNA-T family